MNQENLITPAMQRAFAKAKAACVRCKSRTDLLQTLGKPDLEIETRHEHLDKLIDGALSVANVLSIPEAPK